LIQIIGRRQCRGFTVDFNSVAVEKGLFFVHTCVPGDRQFGKIAGVDLLAIDDFGLKPLK
jgi:hypothetical protein